jgi:hypothetical protein
MSNPMTQAPTVTKRQEAQRAERRRRQDTGIGRLDRLSVPGKKDSSYVYRWVNDTGGRVQMLTQSDDYDVVTYSELGAVPTDKDIAVGDGVTRIGDKSNGQRVVLLKKRKDYFEDDKRKEQEFLDKRISGLRKGDVGDQRGLQPGGTTYGDVQIAEPRRNSS